VSAVEVPLTQGFVAIIDAQDADRVLSLKWCARRTPHTVYAHRGAYHNGKRSSQTLHQFITGYALTDHINGNGLDNRRSNLREATISQNGHNRRRDRDSSSGYKGVSWHARSGKWQVLIRANGPQKFLGYYVTAEEAARAYDAAARELHGEYAAVNFPQHGERAA
jgi:hypothetical protein